MKRGQRLRRWLLAPLVYLLALCLLMEDRLWLVGVRLTRGLGRWPPLQRCEARIGRLGAPAALVLLVLPALLLLPVKLLALYAMAQGHAVAGLLVIVLAKLAGAAAVARLYLLTRPALLSMAWFARLLGRWRALKTACIARLQASAPWRAARLLRQGLRRWTRTRLRPWLRGWRSAPSGLGRMLGRTLRRYGAQWRARRR